MDLSFLTPSLLQFPEEEEIKKLEKEIEKIDKKIDEINDLKSRYSSIIVHKKCGMEVREIDQEADLRYKDEIRSTYYCYRCEKRFTVVYKMFCYKGFNYKYWEPDPFFCVTKDIVLDPELEIKVPKKLRELEAQELELIEKRKEIEQIIKELKYKVAEKRYKIARRIAEKLGIKVVEEDNGFIVFSDGTVYFKGDITTEPYFTKTSELFDKVEEKIGLRNAKDVWHAARGVFYV